MPKRLFVCLVPFFALVAASGAAEPGPPASPNDANCFTQNFDLVTAPSLPSGWSAFNIQGGSPVWVTDAGAANTAPNSAFVPDSANVTDKVLVSPEISITSQTAQLSFWSNYDFSSAAGVLEYSLFHSGVFGDITQGGGTITAGAYNVTVQSSGSPLYGRQAWGGSSGGWVLTTITLNGMAGNQAVFRWRMASPAGGGGGAGWRVDSIAISQPCTLPVGLVVDQRASTNAPSPATPDAAALNGVWEPGETVVIEPAYYNGGSLAEAPTGAIIGASTVNGSVGFLDIAADYGTMYPGVLSSCYLATDNCYQLTFTPGGNRPTDWDAALIEQLSDGGAKVWYVHLGDSFTDVPTSNPFYAFVENVLHNGVTGGCGQFLYCPDTSTLRKQMAVFVLKAKLGHAYTPPSCVGTFTDVACPGPFTDWIEDLYRRGIAAGCGPGPTYCPEAAVSRQQMAVFLLKGLNGSGYVPPACQGVFGDVPCSSPFAPWIEDLYTRQIAAGCGGGNFCPTNPTTRGQMAPFLVKTFGLLLYGP